MYVKCKIIHRTSYRKESWIQQLNLKDHDLIIHMVNGSLAFTYFCCMLDFVHLSGNLSSFFPYFHKL